MTKYTYDYAAGLLDDTTLHIMQINLVSNIPNPVGKQ